MERVEVSRVEAARLPMMRGVVAGELGALLCWAEATNAAGAERMVAIGRPTDCSCALIMDGVMALAAVAAWAALSIAIDTLTATPVVARRLLTALAETVT